jgi:hypothetical protein
MFAGSRCGKVKLAITNSRSCEVAAVGQINSVLRSSQELLGLATGEAIFETKEDL